MAYTCVHGFFRTSAAKIIVDNGRQICHTLVRERQDKCD